MTFQNQLKHESILHQLLTNQVTQCHMQRTAICIIIKVNDYFNQLHKF